MEREKYQNRIYEENAEKSASPVAVGDLLKDKIQLEAKQRGGVNSERADVIAQLIVFMGEKNDRFKYWLGRTRKLTPSRIYQLIRSAKDGNNPPALFNYLLKKEK